MNTVYYFNTITSLDQMLDHPPVAVRRLCILLLLSAVVSACQTRDQPQDPPRTEKNSPDTADKHNQVDENTHQNSNTNKESPELIELLPPHPETLPEPVVSVALGVTPLSEVDQKWQKHGTDWPSAPGATLAVDAMSSRHPGRGDRVNLVRLQLPKTFDNASLFARWGKPRDAPDNSGVIVNGKPLPAHYWFNEATGVRTKLVQTGVPTLVWTRYTPWRSLVPTDGSPSPLLRADVFQSSLEELAESLGAARVQDRPGRLVLHSTEFGHLPITIDMSPKADDRWLVLAIEFGNFLEGRAEMVLFLTTLHRDYGMPPLTKPMAPGPTGGTSNGGDVTQTADESGGDDTPALRPTLEPSKPMDWVHEGLAFSLEKARGVSAAWRLTVRPAP